MGLNIRAVSHKRFPLLKKIELQYGIKKVEDKLAISLVT